jgi:hypothetical protein
MTHDIGVANAYIVAVCCRETGVLLLDLLPAATVLAPGHSPMTTFTHERKFNPFLVRGSRWEKGRSLTSVPVLI